MRHSVACPVAALHYNAVNGLDRDLMGHLTGQHGNSASIRASWLAGGGKLVRAHRIWEVRY